MLLTGMDHAAWFGALALAALCLLAAEAAISQTWLRRAP